MYTQPELQLILEAIDRGSYRPREFDIIKALINKTVDLINGLEKENGRTQ